MDLRVITGCLELKPWRKSINPLAPIDVKLMIAYHLILKIWDKILLSVHVLPDGKNYLNL